MTSPEWQGTGKRTDLGCVLEAASTRLVLYMQVPLDKGLDILPDTRHRCLSLQLGFRFAAQGC